MRIVSNAKCQRVHVLAIWLVYTATKVSATLYVLYYFNEDLENIFN